MPFGKLNTKDIALPLCSPSYSNHKNEATDITMISVIYRVGASSISDLIPDLFEIDDEPLVTSRWIHYDFSTVGPYSEFVQQVEVTYQNEKFDHNLILVLDNDAAIFLGRERFGFPKVYGKVSIDTSSSRRCYLGNTEHPVGRPIVDFEFLPEQLIKAPPRPKKWMINIRSVPSPFSDSPSSIHEVIPVTMDMEFSDMMLGKGAVNFRGYSTVDPWANVDIVKYEGAFMVRNAKARLHARGEGRL